MVLPFGDATFDAVLIATVLGEVPDVDRCLAEAHRVLRPGSGVLSIGETRRDSDFIALPALRARVERLPFRLLGRAGFRWQFVARFVRD